VLRKAEGGLVAQMAAELPHAGGTRVHRTENALQEDIHVLRQPRAIRPRGLSLAQPRWVQLHAVAGAERDLMCDLREQRLDRRLQHPQVSMSGHSAVLRQQLRRQRIATEEHRRFRSVANFTGDQVF
jgi:hypothetical protein